jgi:hypothetical protein
MHDVRPNSLKQCRDVGQDLHVSWDELTQRLHVRLRVNDRDETGASGAVYRAYVLEPHLAASNDGDADDAGTGVV